MNKIELHKLYKEETGNPYMQVQYAESELKDEADDDIEWNYLTIEQYIIWLENRLMELL